MSWQLLLSLDKTIYPLEVTGWVTGQDQMKTALSFTFKEPFIYLQQAEKSCASIMAANGKITAMITGIRS